MDFNQIEFDAGSSKIKVKNEKLNVPDNPIIPFIEGDGIGPDIWEAAERVINAAVEKAYNGEKKISWFEIFAGEKAFNKTGEWLPQQTLDAIEYFTIAIKGPLTTPVGGGVPQSKCDNQTKTRSFCLCSPGSLF